MKEMEKGRNRVSLGYTAALRRKVRGHVHSQTSRSPDRGDKAQSLVESREAKRSSRTKPERLLSSRAAHKGAGPNTQVLVCAFVLREKRKFSMDF